MLACRSDGKAPAQHYRNPRKLWHDGARFPPSLGCFNTCPDYSICGGLQLDRALFDCLDLCCGNPASCDAVCRNKPADFAMRVREVEGFCLNNVPRAPVLCSPSLPSAIPILFHGSCRSVSFAPTAVCLPLYKVIPRYDETIRFNNNNELASHFGFSPGIPVILSGTANDRPLERWWSLGSQRRSVIRKLREIEIALVTTPNYSVFSDQPRWDDLHSMKRIAITHEEFLAEGLPAALHINARTERDWDRWTAYIETRCEVTHIAFEFGTGARYAQRAQWHADQLSQLATRVHRPLHLVVRGGIKVMGTLRRAFPEITLLDTVSFTKTIKRKRASISAGRLTWTDSPTSTMAELDDLLSDNWSTVDSYLGSVVEPLDAVSR